MAPCRNARKANYQIKIQKYSQNKFSRCRGEFIRPGRIGIYASHHSGMDSQGYHEGKALGIEQTALKLLQQGANLETITAVTGLSPQE